MITLRFEYQGTDRVREADWAEFECRSTEAAEVLRDALVEAGFMVEWKGEHEVRVRERDRDL
jgi:hypothetical protein